MIKTAILAATTTVLTTLAAQAQSPSVVVSIKPVHSLVAAVMDGVGVPDLIVKGAGSPHAYSMRPSDARALENAALVFWIGGGLETFLEGPIGTVAAKARIVELGDAHGLTRLELRGGGAFETHSHDEHEDHGHDQDHGHDHHDDKKGDAHADHKEGDGHHHEEADMHLWLDPHNARAMVAEIVEALSSTDPENASRYADNARSVQERLDALETELQTALRPIAGKPFVVFHDAYQYFERRFGVEAAGSITVNPDAAPGAQRISEIRAKIMELGAVCVFSEPQFEPRVISVVTEGTGARSGELDPLGADLEDGPDLYFSLLRNLGDGLKDCLAEQG